MLQAKENHSENQVYTARQHHLHRLAHTLGSHYVCLSLLVRVLRPQRLTLASQYASAEQRASYGYVLPNVMEEERSQTGEGEPPEKNS